MQSLAELALKMHESIDLTDEREVKRFIGFTQVGENLIGVRRRATRLMEEDALEIGPGGVVTPRRDPLGLYIIYGGRAGHVCLVLPRLRRAAALLRSRDQQPRIRDLLEG